MAPEARDRGQGDWRQLLDQASSTGKLMAHHSRNTDEIVAAAHSFALGHKRHDYLAQSVLWTVVETRLWDKELPVGNALAVAARMTPDRSLGNSLADAGKYLAREEGYEDKSHPTLRLTARVFKKAWDHERDSGTLDTELLTDFTRVAGLQDEAGDRAGAQITARMIVPRLLAYEKQPDFEKDEHYDSWMDHEKEMLLAHLDESENPYHQELYNTLGTEARMRVDQRISSDEALQMLHSGEIDSAFAKVREGNTQIDFTIQFVPYLARVIRSGEKEKAAGLLDRFRESFPDEFEGDQNVSLGFLPLTEVLVALDRHELLAGMIAATQVGDELDKVNAPKHTNAGIHAMRAGANIFFQDQGEDTLERFKGYLPDDLKPVSQEGFEMAKKHRETQVDELKTQVTEAIIKAERLDDSGDPEAQSAYAEVSVIEEQLAGLLPNSSFEGQIARRGAVRAAIKAGDIERAESLVDTFLGEVGIDQQLVEELQAFMPKKADN